MRDAERLTEVLLAGGLAVVPTDTVYGLVARASDPAATAALFVAKARAADAPIAVLCADADQALDLSQPPPSTELVAAARRWWPGPLTLVVPRRRGLDLELGEPRDTVGVRVPHHGVLQAVAARVGPIAATSANRHGEPTPATAAEAAAALEGGIDLVIDGGTLGGLASTVIDATSWPWRVLREGSVAAAEVVATATAARAAAG